MVALISNIAKNGSAIQFSILSSQFFSFNSLNKWQFTRLLDVKSFIVAYDCCVSSCDLFAQIWYQYFAEATVSTIPAKMHRQAI